MFALAGWEMRLHSVSQNNARDRPKRHEHGRRSSIGMNILIASSHEI